MLISWSVYEEHSGYDFQGTWLDTFGLTHCVQTAHHDFHHTSNIGNYGVVYMDWLFGSMDSYCSCTEKWNSRRHIKSDKNIDNDVINNNENTNNNNNNKSSSNDNTNNNE